MTQTGDRASPRTELARHVEVPAKAADSVSVHGSADELAEKRPGCSWLLAAAHTGDPRVVSAVIRLHPPTLCPSAKRQRAA